MNRLWIVLGVLALTAGCALSAAEPVQGATHLTTQQQAVKDAICNKFNSNAQAPIVALSRAQIAAGCPWVNA